jgi:hypothetical protein
LNERLAAEFGEVVDAAITIARSAEPQDAASLSLQLNLLELNEYVEATAVTSLTPGAPRHEETSEWVTVVKPGQKAIHVDGSDTEEITVLSYRYTPMGLLYKLEPPRPGVDWSVKAGSVVPINGVSEVEEFNLMTGETRPLA